MSTNSNDQCQTTVTQLTPAGRGAVATLHLEGADALELLGAFFSPTVGKPMAASPIDRIRFGTWQHSNGDREEVVVCRRGEQEIEIHCHGGDAAAAAIMAGFVARGAVAGDPATWLQRRQADSLTDFVRLRLAEARTQRTAGILLDQLHGAWAGTLGQIAAALEADQREVASGKLRRLIDLVPLGRHLTVPWQVVVVGPPNVGKSSLVNTMLGFTRCLVFAQPGTTRDVVSTHTALDGWPIELMDTAGLRDVPDVVEAEGVQRALSQIAAADLVIEVREATCWDRSVPDPAIVGHRNVLTVANKLDLAKDPVPAADVLTSAVTKEGVDLLIERIVRGLVPHPPVPGEAVPLCKAHHQLLVEVLASVAGGDVQAARAALATSAESKAGSRMPR